MPTPHNSFTLKALRARFGERALARGYRLAREGGVARLGWENGAWHVRVGRVEPVSVRIRFGPEDVTLACDCESESPCAHQAAAMIDWADNPVERPGDVPLPAPGGVPWQVALHRALEGAQVQAEPAPDRVRLVCVLGINADGDPVVEPHKVEFGPHGPVKWSPFGLVRNWGADPLEPRPDFLRPEDVTLCRQLRQFPEDVSRRSPRKGSARFCPPPEVRYGILMGLARRGRLYVRADPAPLPVAPGPGRAVVPAVAALEDGGMQLWLADPATGAGALSAGVQVIAAEPPLYLEDRTLGCLVTSLPGALAATLARTPLHVPAADREQFGAHWLPRLFMLGEVQLPPELEPETVEGVLPVPRLSLIDVAGELLLHVEFVYGEAAPVPPAGTARPLAVRGRRLTAYARDLEREHGHLARMLSPRVATDAAPAARSPGAWVLSGDDAYDYMLFELPALAAEGWEIYGEEGLSRHRVFRGRTAITGRVRSGIDWFDLELAADFDGVSLPPSDLLAAWERGRRYVRLADGRVARIPDWVRERAEALQEAGLAKRTHARLSRFQVPLILELTEGTTTQLDDPFQDMAARVRGFSGIGPVAPPEGLMAELRPYQLEGLAWLDFLREYGFHGILADDMGLGKTIQVIALLLLERQRGRLDGPSLVVVPTSLIFNWLHEIGRFAPSLRTTAWHGMDRHRRQGELQSADVILTNYALIRQDFALLESMEFHYLVLDEAQYIKNPQSQVSHAVRELTARHRLALTGTPLENHLGELWSQFAFLMPGLLGDYGHFRRRFGGPVERGDREAAKALLNRVRPFILRRAKEQVAAELPERVETVLYCRLEGGQRRLYEQIRDLCRIRVAESIQRRGLGRSRVAILDALLKLRQVCCHPGLLPDGLAGGVTHSAKMDLFMEFITEALEEEHRVLVFSQFVSMLSILRRHLEESHVPYVYLDGRTRDRERRVREFQENRDIPVFLISLKAGGTGLNLTGADYVVHFDPWWNPAVERQATDRAHRIGQTRKVFSYKLIAEDTVEEKILALQDRKRELSDLLLGGETAMVGQLSVTELQNIFGDMGL